MSTINYIQKKLNTDSYTDKQSIIDEYSTFYIVKMTHCGILDAEEIIYITSTRDYFKGITKKINNAKAYKKYFNVLKRIIQFLDDVKNFKIRNVYPNDVIKITLVEFKINSYKGLYYNQSYEITEKEIDSYLLKKSLNLL